MAMTDEEIDEILLETALAVPSNPVPHRVLLAALRDQVDHYVSERVDGLMDVAGVSPHKGVALITRGCDRGIVPPGGIVRETGEYAVLFYKERWKRGQTPPWVGTADPKMREILSPCISACARWGEGDDESVFYPWGYVHHAKRWDDKPAGDPAEFHAQSFADGHTHGIVAVAAGRLDGEVLAIATTRWMFPIEKKVTR